MSQLKNYLILLLNNIFYWRNLKKKTFFGCTGKHNSVKFRNLFKMISDARLIYKIVFFNKKKFLFKPNQICRVQF